MLPSELQQKEGAAELRKHRWLLYKPQGQHGKQLQLTWTSPTLWDLSTSLAPRGRGAGRKLAWKKHLPLGAGMERGWGHTKPYSSLLLWTGQPSTAALQAPALLNLKDQHKRCPPGKKISSPGQVGLEEGVLISPEALGALLGLGPAAGQLHRLLPKEGCIRA